MNQMDDQLTKILEAHLCKPKSVSPVNHHILSIPKWKDEVPSTRNKHTPINNHVPSINESKSNSLHSILARQLKKPTSAPSSPSAGTILTKKSNKKSEKALKRTKSTKTPSKISSRKSTSPTTIQESLYRTSKQLEISTATMNTTALSPGLPNIGNSCYANAILQVLFSLPPFTYQLKIPLNSGNLPQEEFSSKNPPKSPVKNSGQPSNIISILKTLLNLRSCPSSLNLKQRHFMSEIILKHGGGQNFSFGQQHDSHEFCMALLDKLSCQDSRGVNSVDSSSHENSVLKQSFNKWFAYNVSTERTCLNCNNSKTEVQPSRELKIFLENDCKSRTSSTDSNLISKSVRSSSRHSKKIRYTDEGESYLDSNLEKFVSIPDFINKIPDSPAASTTSGTPVTIKTQDIIDNSLDDKYGIDWKCDKCSYFNQNSLRKIRITNLPVVLIVVLQRFMFDAKTCNLQKLNNNIKIDHEISVEKLVKLGSEGSIPIENEIVDQLVPEYKLMAVVDHIGANAIDGHYTATCLEPKQTLINHTPGIESELEVDGDDLVWTEYDDLIVKPYRQNMKCFPDESSTAYMLFYLNKGVKVKKDY